MKFYIRKDNFVYVAIRDPLAPWLTNGMQALEQLMLYEHDYEERACVQFRV
jgi:hypothetical protein